MPAVQVLARAFEGIEGELASAASVEALLTALTASALRHVPSADHAGVTVVRAGPFRSVATTDPLVEQVDQVQYSEGSGPCVDAALTSSIFNAVDLSTDPRWPEFGRVVAERFGIRSMLAIRLFLENDADTLAGLNLYAGCPNAFGPDAE